MVDIAYAPEKKTETDSRGVERRITSPKEARLLGLTTYFTGKPCKHGHIAERKIARGDCVECASSRDKRYYSKNSEKIKQRTKQYGADNSEEVSARHSLYYMKNKEKIDARQKAWRKRNIDRLRIKGRQYAAKRKALKLGAGGQYTADDVAVLLRQQDGRCKYCNARIHDSYEVDHITPLSKGGSNDPDNIQLLCRRCNRSKWARTPEEWEAAKDKKMAKIPLPIDPTLEAADRALEKKENSQAPRPYLGMSSVGEECERKLWLRYRWAYPETFDAVSLKRFADGHYIEDVMASRLRMVPGIELLTVDPATGRQIGFVDMGGHFKGHADGVISGILQAPKTRHIWEAKAVSDDKKAKLEKLKMQLGEKLALREWDFTYYVQAILYCHYSGLERHYLTCATPGGRAWTSVRTEPDPPEAMRQIAKARRVIFSPVPLPRVSEKPDYYKCKDSWCSFAGLCHGGGFARRNCRTCLFSSPIEDGNGTWRCEKWGDAIPLEFQRKGCEAHRFIPNLVPGEQTDAAEDGSFVVYRLADGTQWTDEGQPTPSNEGQVTP